MITVTDYTTYNDVRAALGLDETELEDATLALTTYASVLQRTLRGTVDSSNKSLYTYYDEISAIADPTDEQDTLLGLIKEFSTYTVAVACLPGLSLMAKKTESDGKATITRFSAEATFKDVANNVTQKWVDIKNEILTSLGVVITYNAITPLLRVEPDTDLVTNS